MYNFLDPKLMPKVTCTTPPTDHFEATNLISDNETLRARGFMAYTVIRPPVDLEFEFLCPVDISYICLQTTVGRQKCTGVEIFARNNTSSYISIARAVYDKPGVTFCNSKKYSKTAPPEHHNSTNDLFFFKADTVRIFRDVCFLKVVIFRTDRSVPCLGSLKVFGGPSRTCSRVTIETVAKIMGVGAPQIPKVGSVTKEKEFKIPEDFTDDLTCEIMAVPMTLPSGKTVDRDTLEKHIENEKSFGRKPCDPFTGLKFDEKRKPVMNVALKSRIDMFLMQNSSNPVTFGLKRTLGSDSFSCKRQKSDRTEQCCICDNRQDLYVIPCRHFYCRDCLLTLKEWKCDSCDREFPRNSAVKYHNK